ncbi:MAG: hypothetical protein HZB65_01250 [Candidatus Aenigmarchaeota archaeon]|nr:hypothetical protein [Candidatus Aenigmarchaeota archaeon]
MAYKTKAIALDNSFGSYVDSAKRSLGDYFSGIGKKSLEFKNLLTNLIEPNNCGEKFKQDFSKYYEEFGAESC